MSYFSAYDSFVSFWSRVYGCLLEKPLGNKKKKEGAMKPKHGWISGEQIDRDVVRKLELCSVCKQPYRYRREDTETPYRAFAVCGCDDEGI